MQQDGIELAGSLKNLGVKLSQNNYSKKSEIVTGGSGQTRLGRKAASCSPRGGQTLDAQNIVNRPFKPVLFRAFLPPSTSTTSGTRVCRSWLSAAHPASSDLVPASLLPGCDESIEEENERGEY